MTTILVDGYRIRKRQQEFHIIFSSAVDRWAEYCPVTTIKTFVNYVSNHKIRSVSH